MYLIDPVHLETFLKPNNTNKKSRGEVFTPLSLVNEMLDKMEEYNPGCFSNPNLKWMDNSCGIGNFLVLVFHRLMSGLSNVFPDPDIRKQHILKNMIYGVDICPLNISICKLIFGINGEENNLVCGDGLVDHFKLKMDCIVGNPPYQKSTGNKGAGHTWWNIFVKHNLEILTDKGFLSLIHPSLWRKYDNKIGKEILKNQIWYLSIHNVKDGLKAFGCSTRYDWYILQKKPSEDKTLIKGENGVLETVCLTERQMVPNYDLNFIYNMCVNNVDKKWMLHSRSTYGTDKKHMSKKEQGEFKYPVVLYVLKNNLSFVYSNTKNNGHFGVPKIILHPHTDNYYYDRKGEYGVSEWSWYIEGDRDYLDNLFGIIRTNKFKRLEGALLVDRSRQNFNCLKKDFYKHFIE